MLKFILIIVVFLNLFLSFFVISRDKKSWNNRLFFLLSFFSAIWTFTNYLTGIYSTPFWLQSTYAFGALVISMGLIWTFFLTDKYLDKKKVALISFIALFFFFSSYGDNFIAKKYEEIRIGGAFIGESGIGLVTYALFFLIAIVLILYKLFVAQKKETNKENRKGLLYVFYGALATLSISFLTSFIFPLFSIFSFTGLDSIGFLIFSSFIAYDITKHHLFNIRVIVTELLVFAIWIFTLIRLLLSTTFQETIINSSFLTLLILSGFLLIRSVLKEVRQREEIQKLSEFKTELLSIVAHQIKNPLIVIKGYASLVEDKTICDAESVSDIFKKIKAAADKLVMLLNNLLDLHRFEEGKIHYEFKKIELNEFLKDIVEGFRIVAQQRNFDLIFEPSPSQIYVDGDIYKLSQVFQNLIDNALKYTEKGWVKVSVGLSLPASGKEAPNAKDQENTMIIISDSGKGMNSDLTQKLFQKFSRGAGESKALGSGLGLYISREIVEAHHGKIWAESDGEGKGSRFIVELPKAA